MPLLPVEEALQRILAGVMPLEEETVGLRFASGRTLSKPLAAKLSNPAFDASAMDGYAVRVEDTRVPGRTLRVIGEAAAGLPFTGTLKAGDAVRIFTGAEVPSGADAIVLQEDTTRSGDAISFHEPAEHARHIRKRGTDFNVGDLLAESGRCLTPRDILLLAAAGHDALPVRRQPTIGILATGDELVEPGVTPQAGEIVSSNSYALAALVEQTGAMVKLRGIAHDTLESLAHHLMLAEPDDLLITTGGASVGDHDLVRPALEAAGATLAFYKLALRPGKPMFYGSRVVRGKTQRILGLPGNPVSAMVCAQLFVLPLIAQFQGRQWTETLENAVLTEPIAANGPRQHYMRAIRDKASTPHRVTPVANQDSALTRAFAAANVLIVVPPNTPAMAAGETVKVIALA